MKQHLCIPASAGATTPRDKHASDQGITRRRIQSRKRRQFGITLFEVVITMSITTVLAGLAFGSLSAISNFSTVSEINNLIADLYYSRSEALKRRVTITICRSNDGETCSKGATWNNGWIVFSDQNRNRKIDDEDQKLLVREGIDELSTLTLGSGYYYYIMFSPIGEAYPRNTFKYCRSNYPPKAIILYATGRARISTQDSSGKPLKC